MADLTLSSPAFESGDRLPDRCGYEKGNHSPPLAIDGVPADAESLVLIVDDPDAMESTGKVFEHWLCWNLPAETSTLPEDWDSGESEGIEGRNDFGEFGYGGPRPPDHEHTYRFGLYALETSLDLDRAASKNDVTHGMHGHVLAHTQLTGTYAP
jgi:Raf kinase inhibitor-like YbhB/YbcL family protein